MDAMQIYVMIQSDASNLKYTFPPIQSPTTSKIAPPKSWEIPVAVTGATLANTFLLITLENTVQKDAQRIKKSPMENENPSELIFRAMIPRKPTAAARIFLEVVKPIP